MRRLRLFALLSVGSGMALTGVVLLPNLTQREKMNGVGRDREVGAEPQEQRLRVMPPVDDPLQYGSKWRERRIITIDSSPPSGAEITFRITDQSGRLPEKVSTDFVGYDELHFLRRKIARRKNKEGIKDAR